jgi:ectoine hydroxylase-related dioxygenase (phytanoyl-CoA dioxygenase family)
VKSDGLLLQAVLNLLDNHEEDGGYWVVPGFHKVFDEYFKNCRGSRKFASHSWSPKDHVGERAKRIPMRQGSMVIWDQRMPHGSKGNDGSRFRAAQFIRMFPAKFVIAARGKARAESIVAKLWRMKTQIEVTDHGKVVFGLSYVDQIVR